MVSSYENKLWGSRIGTIIRRDTQETDTKRTVDMIASFKTTDI